MKKIPNKDIILLLIAILLSITSIGVMLFSDYALNEKHYIGFGLVGVSSVLYFNYKKLYVYAFGITLLIGTLNLIDIFYFNITLRIGLIAFNPLFLSLLILFLVLNKDLLNKLFPEKEMTDKGVEKVNLIKNYERKFKLKTDLELKAIAEEKSHYVNEAKIASQNILKARYNNIK